MSSKLTAECIGGPYDGKRMDARMARGDSTIVFTVGGKTGRYVLQARTIKPNLVWEDVPTSGS